MCYINKNCGAPNMKGENIMTKKDMIKKQDSLASMFDAYRFGPLFSELASIMDRAWSDRDLTSSAFCALQPKSSLPKINVAETEEQFEVEIAIAGFDKKNLELEFKDDCLFIKADKSEENETEGKRWLQREISSRSFRRSIQFPSNIDADTISSAYDEDRGVVVCVLPKKTKIESGIKKIDIN